MGLFFDQQKNSSVIAKDRLKILLLAERIQCAPTLLQMLKNDLIQTANKYVIVQNHLVTITYNALNDTVTANFPLEHNNFRKRNPYTNV